MRNRYPGDCYRCGQLVAAGDGHFELLGRKWRVQHATCAIAHRGEPDAARQAHSQQLREQKAQGTGKRAQRARARMRAMEVSTPPEPGLSGRGEEGSSAVAGDADAPRFAAAKDAQSQAGGDNA